MSPDFSALRRDSSIIEELEQLYSGPLNADFTKHLHTADHVPLWAITAASDNWVSVVSARAQVPVDQRRAVVDSHTSICKPATKDASSYRHVVDILRTILPECVPAKVHRITSKGFEIRPATEADAVAVYELAKRMFPGQDLSPPETVVRWLKWDPYCVWIVRKLSGGAASGLLQGYWCAFSLTAAATELVKTGKLTGPAIRYEHFPDGIHDQGGIYVGAVAGINPMAKGIVMKYAERELARRTDGRVVDVLARAVTEDGLELVESLGFDGIDGNRLGGIFCGASSAQIRGRRRRRRR
jgi:hypothetical protein